MTATNHEMRNKVLKEIPPLKAGECVTWAPPDGVLFKKFSAKVASRVAWYFREGYYGKCRVEANWMKQTVTIWKVEED